MNLVQLLQAIACFNSTLRTNVVKKKRKQAISVALHIAFSAHFLVAVDQ
jgi:hypothetical protein